MRILKDDSMRILKDDSMRILKDDSMRILKDDSMRILKDDSMRILKDDSMRILKDGGIRMNLELAPITPERHSIAVGGGGNHDMAADHPKVLSTPGGKIEYQVSTSVNKTSTLVCGADNQRGHEHGGG